MSTKPKIFLYGGCDLHDMAKSLVLRREFEVIDHSPEHIVVDESSLDFSKQSFPGEGRSLASLYTPPGPLALRILETLEKSLESQKKVAAPIYKEVFKFPILDYFKKNAGKNDYLLLSFSPEIYTKFYDGRECFTISPPAFKGITKSNHCLYWLYEEYLSKDDFLMPFDKKESLNWISDLTHDFARDIYEIFQDRVFLIATHFSNFAIDYDHSVKKFKASVNDILFYKQSKVVSDPLDHSYMQRSCDIQVNKFIRRYKTDLKLIKLDEIVFLDANHRWGASQFHIDIRSRTKLAELTYQEIKKHMSTQDARIS